MSPDVFGEKNGAAEGTRTPDPIITNDVLYHLSYSGTFRTAGVLGKIWRGSVESRLFYHTACRIGRFTSGLAAAVQLSNCWGALV